MPIPYRALLAGVVLLAAPHISNADTAHATNVTPAVAAQPATIDGFRSAHFGMSEADIRKAIKHDFALSGSSVQTGVNPLQRTQMINIAVPDLVPGSGKATINYIFGYTSQRLIEINVTWATAADPAMTAFAAAYRLDTARIFPRRGVSFRTNSFQRGSGKWQRAVVPRHGCRRTHRRLGSGRFAADGCQNP